MLVDRLEDLYRTMCSDHQKGRTPRPDLSNLDAYLEAGIGHDHENQELLAMADYHGLYKAGLARLHRARPMQADERVWTAEDIALVEGDTFKRAAHASKASNDHATNMPAKRRMTGTR